MVSQVSKIRDEKVNNQTPSRILVLVTFLYIYRYIFLIHSSEKVNTPLWQRLLIKHRTPLSEDRKKSKG